MEKTFTGPVDVSVRRRPFIHIVVARFVLCFWQKVTVGVALMCKEPIACLT